MPNIGTYQISDAENELEGLLHGTTTNQITDLYGLFNRAARRVMEDIDAQETKIIAAFGKVYNGVFDYPLFTDVKGNKVIDFFPQANRTTLDNYAQNYNKDFDLWKNYRVTPDFTPRYAGAVRTIRLNATNLVAGTQINPADLITDGGTWVTGGNASNVQNNSLFFTDGVAGSVQCQLNQTGVSSTGYLQNSTFTPVNLTQNYQNNANFFFWVYIPDVTAVTAITFEVGSSASNYYSQAAITTTATGGNFANGWNLVSVAWATMTIVGSPNVASIGFLQITFTYNGTLQQQILINQFYSRIGTLFNMEYYSKYLFRDSTTGVFQEKVTADSNYINLDTDGYNCFLFAAGIEAVQQQQGLDASFADAPNFDGRYQAAITTYKNKYKSETQKPQTTYYYMPARGYGRWFGGGNSYSNL